ncbi:MAG: hypothetical protein ACREDR_43025, partial [Blastocatellia bacterium]
GRERYVGEMLVCTFCQTQFVVSRAEDLKNLLVDAKWARRDGLKALIAKTNPQIGTAPGAGAPSTRQFLALLQEAQARSAVSVFSALYSAGAGALFGGVLFYCLFWLFVVLGYKFGGLSTDNGSGIASASGAVIGFLVGGALPFIRTPRLIAQSIIKSGINKNGLKIDQLRQVLNRQPDGLTRARKALDVLARTNSDSKSPPSNNAKRNHRPGRATCPVCNLISSAGVRECRRCGTAIV